MGGLKFLSNTLNQERSAWVQVVVPMWKNALLSLSATPCPGPVGEHVFSPEGLQGTGRDWNEVAHVQFTAYKYLDISTLALN